VAACAYFYVCVYVYIYTHVHIYIYVYMYIYISKSTHTCVDVYIYLYMYIQVSTGQMDSGKPVVNGARAVPGAVCATRRSRISDKQRAPSAARQRSWIPTSTTARGSEPCVPAPADTVNSG
jgi:hypothetical protein